MLVCQADRPEHFAQATGIAIAALITGALVGRLTKARHWRVGLLFSLLAGVLLPSIAMYGVWPFDARWRHGCAVDAVPNLWVYYALLAWLPLVVGANLAFRRLSSK